MYDSPFHIITLDKSGIGPRAGTCGTYFPIMFKALGVNTTIRNGPAADMAANEVRFFTFTDDELRKLKTALPELSDATIPRGTYNQLAEDHKTVGVFNSGIAHNDLPESLVYAITRAVLENNAQMVKGHAAARETLLQNWRRNGAPRDTRQRLGARGTASA